MNTIEKHIIFVSEIFKGHITQKRIPILVTLCVTNRCNLRCVYCYSQYYNKNYNEFTTDQILSLIDGLSKMGTRLISINGGEALLRDDIDIIINKINEKNILCQLASNGLLIKKKIHTLKKIDSLCLSIDGFKDSNDLNRGQGTYDKIIEAIECLNKNKIKFHTNTVLTKNNKNAVNEVMSLADEYKFKAQFSLLRAEDSPNKNICLSDDEIRRTIVKISDYKKSRFPIFYSRYAFSKILDWPFSYDREMIFDSIPKGYKPIRCFIKKFSCQIEPNGLVYPCIVLVNKIKALNFLEVGFKKAWEHLANNECKACYNICCSDLNLMFSFKPVVFWNAFKIVMERILYQYSMR